MVDDYMLHKVLDYIKEIIGIGKFDDTNLIDTYNELPDDITLKISSKNNFRRSIVY